MYVRDAKNRDEVWLLDHIEAMGLDETAFRSRDYAIAVDEESRERAGFGRYRVHKAGDRERTPTGRGTDDASDVCELTSIGVGAHVIERLCKHARDEGFDRVYALTDRPEYLGQFGFERIDAAELPGVLETRLAEKREGVAPEAVPTVLDVDEFRMPDRLRKRFKHADRRETGPEAETDPDPEAAAEEFGIDPESATYKYDTGG